MFVTFLLMNKISGKPLKFPFCMYQPLWFREIIHENLAKFILT